MGWIGAKELGTEHNGKFGWVVSEGIALAFPKLAYTYIDCMRRRVFQDAVTVGDRVGLRVEFFEGVTHFMPLVEPEIPTNGTEATATART